MLRLGGDVLGPVPYSPHWPLPPRDPAWACCGWRALAVQHAPAAERRFPGLGPPCSPPPPLARLPDPLPGVGVPLLVAVMTSGASCRLLLPGLWQGAGGGGGGLQLPCPPGVRRKGGMGSGGAAPRLPLGELGVWRAGGGGALHVAPRPHPWLPSGACGCVGPRQHGPTPMFASSPRQALSRRRTP